MSGTSFLWYDLETFGLDPIWDRPAQFAGIRTDAEFNEQGPAVTLYCRPPADYLPDPQACLVTRLSPQQMLNSGVPEAEFASMIREAFLKPGTCVVGFNNLRFDDEVMRQVFYRCLFDPYEREWRNGNSRWDIIDMLRLVQALRPEGLEWPRDEHGHPCFRLEALTAANGIPHGDAHDALCDVQATIQLARRVRVAQPRLFDFVLANRGRAEALSLLRVGSGEPVVHVSSRFPAERNCLAIVLALAMHPSNRNAVIVCDLDADPAAWLDLDTDTLRERLYTRTSHLDPGMTRIPLKLVHINKAPVLSPLNSLRPQDWDRLCMDRDRLFRHLDRIRRTPGIREKVSAVFARQNLPAVTDPDAALYSGGFIGPADRAELDRLRARPIAEWGRQAPCFSDVRLPELVFRYRARNFPGSLDADERERWELQRLGRLYGSDGNGFRTIDSYRTSLDVLEAMANDPATRRLLTDLRAYGEKLLSDSVDGFTYNPRL